jgi:hypothetical protein
MRQGPHQAAQQSSSTGRALDASTTSRAKLASVTSRGFLSSDEDEEDDEPLGVDAPAAPSFSSFAPHLPHTGCLPTTVTRSSTRLFAPHFAHLMIAIAKTSAPEENHRRGIFLSASLTQSRAATEAAKNVA